jgi:hypothetical protein
MLLKSTIKRLLSPLPSGVRDNLIRVLKTWVRAVQTRLLPNDPCGDIIARVPCVIRRPGYYRLARDLIYGDAAGTAIAITVSGVTIDLQGFALRNNAGSATCATGIGGAEVADVAVVNGTVAEFRYGIFLSRGQRYRVADVRAEANWQWGLSVEGDDCVIRDNVILDTGGSTASCSKVCIGIRAFGARQTVERNVISGLRRSPCNAEWVGTHFDSAPNARFTQNIVAATACEPRTWGLWLNGGHWRDAGRTNVLVTENLFINAHTAGAFVDYAAGTCTDNVLVNVVEAFVVGGPEVRMRNEGGNVQYVRVRHQGDGHSARGSRFIVSRTEEASVKD